MRHGIQKDPDWEYLAALLADGDDNDQVAFFKAFLKECSSWGTRLQVENQFAFINGKLTDAEKEAFSMISYMGAGNE